MRTIILFSLLFTTACSKPLIYDTHVHLMSPDLIAEWKEMGIPFSRPEAYYSDIDTILSRNGAYSVDLIGMGYAYGNAEFYQDGDEYEMLKRENDYLIQTAEKYPVRVRPFIAIDPLKEYAIREIERCWERNKDSGLKLHFSASQVYLTESEHLEKVRPIFRLAAEKQMPVLLHFDNWHPKFGEPDVTILVDSILRNIPPLNLRIAHFGSSGGYNDKTRTVLDEFARRYREKSIPGNHRILFDISAVALDKDSEGVSKLSDSEFQDLKAYVETIGIDRVIFGTDYPLYESAEYLAILKDRVGLTKKQVRRILANGIKYKR